MKKILIKIYNFLEKINPIELSKKWLIRFLFFYFKNRNEQKEIDDDLILVCDNGLGDNIILFSILEDLNNIYKNKNYKLVILLQEKYKELFESKKLKYIKYEYINFNVSKMKEEWKSLISLFKAIKKQLKKFNNTKFKNIFIFRNCCFSDDLIVLNFLSSKMIYKQNNHNFQLLKENFENVNNEYSISFLPKVAQCKVNRKITLNIFKINEVYKKHRSTIFLEMISKINLVKYEKHKDNTKDNCNNFCDFKKINSIIVNPFSSEKEKNINLTLLCKILNKICDINPSIKITFAYSKDDKLDLTILKNICKFNIYTKSNLSINQYIEEINKHDLIITNESGTLHVANYCNKKTICFVNTNHSVFKYDLFYWLYFNEKTTYIYLDNEYFFEEINEQYFLNDIIFKLFETNKPLQQNIYIKKGLTIF